MICVILQLNRVVSTYLDPQNGRSHFYLSQLSRHSPKPFKRFQQNLVLRPTPKFLEDFNIGISRCPEEILENSKKRRN